MRAAVSLLAFALALAPLGRAAAFERSSVEGEPDRGLFWRYRTVVVHSAVRDVSGVSSAAGAEAFARSRAEWNDAARRCSELVIEEGGAPADDRTTLSDGQPDRENRIVWRDDAWPTELDPAVLAVTTVVYRRSTGEIVDADMDLNAVHHEWTTTDEPARARVDVQNTVTHELGHVIGLAHSDDATATMFAVSELGELHKRELADDDRDGLCFIYPEGRLSPGAPVLEGTPLTGACAASSRAPSGAPWAASILVLALTGPRRRRRGAPRSRPRGERV